MLSPSSPPIININSGSDAGPSRIYTAIRQYLFGNSGDYTTNLGSNTNRKHLFSQSPDTPTFQPVADVLAEINPARLAADAESIFEGSAEYRGFYIHAWLIDGYGCVGEVRDAGNNIMPSWMNTNTPVEFVVDAVNFMIARIDEYIEAVTS